jgi:hypothetical protein
MKSHLLKRIIICICIALLFIGIAIGYLRLSAYKKARTQLDEMNTSFFNACLHAAQTSGVIDFSEFIPAEWDKMYVFGAYTTKEEKFAAAGCEYNPAISSGISESLISILFMHGDDVVYYIEFYPWQIQTPYSICLVIDKEFDRASFTPSDCPRLVLSADKLPVDRQIADEIVRFTLTTGN